MSVEQVLRKELTGIKVEIETGPEETFLTLESASIAGAMKVLRDNKDCRFDYMRCLCGVDYPDYVKIVYLLLSTKTKEKITVYTDVPKDNLRVASVTGLWAGADWHERETAEMFGVVFDGHPDPRKLFLADDNDAHPLRKDFKLDYGEK